MSHCISTSEINNEYYFNVGITDHKIDFHGRTVDFFVYRPMNMASKKILLFISPVEMEMQKNIFNRQCL